MAADTKGAAAKTPAETSMARDAISPAGLGSSASGGGAAGSTASHQALPQASRAWTHASYCMKGGQIARRDCNRALDRAGGRVLERSYYDRLASLLATPTRRAVAASGARMLDREPVHATYRLARPATDAEEEGASHGD